MPSPADFLLAFLGGAGQGYESGQRRQDELHTLKIKADLDRQDQVLRSQQLAHDYEHQQATDSMIPSQIEHNKAESGRLGGQETRDSERYTSGLQPFQPGAGALAPYTVGQHTYQIPNRMDYLEGTALPKMFDTEADLERAHMMGEYGLREQGLRNQGDINNLNYREHHPNINRAPGESPLLKTLLDAQGPPSENEILLATRDGKTPGDLTLDRLVKLITHPIMGPIIRKELGISDSLITQPAGNSRFNKPRKKQ